MTVHKSSRGTPVDMAALAKRHEQVRAVSNVNANARGDIIDSHNRVVVPVTHRVAQSYNATTKVRSVVTAPAQPIDAVKTPVVAAPQPETVEETPPKVRKFKTPKISPDPVEMEELTAEERQLEQEFGDENE